MLFPKDSEMREAFSEISEKAPYFSEISETSGWFSERFGNERGFFRKFRKIIVWMLHNGPFISKQCICA